MICTLRKLNGLVHEDHSVVLRCGSNIICVGVGIQRDLMSFMCVKQ